MKKPTTRPLNGISPTDVAIALCQLQEIAMQEDVPLSQVIDTWRTMEVARAAAMHNQQMTELNGNLSSIDQSICDYLVRVERAVLGLIS